MLNEIYPNSSKKRKKKKIYNQSYNYLLIIKLCSAQIKNIMQQITSIPVTPSASFKFGVSLKGTFSGTRNVLPFSKHTL